MSAPGTMGGGAYIALVCHRQWRAWLEDRLEALAALEAEPGEPEPEQLPLERAA